jgi:hypothetical protein
MAKKPPVSYASMEVSEGVIEQEAVPAQAEAVIRPIPQPVGQGARTLKEVSAHIMTYIHPDAAKALKRYAVENNCKVHDLCVEAFQNWFDAHGLREKVRVEPRLPDGPKPSKY